MSYLDTFKYELSIGAHIQYEETGEDALMHEHIP